MTMEVKDLQSIKTMKHFWTHDTINRGRSAREAQEWITAKCLELKAKTGVPWSASTGGDGVNFLPFMTRELCEMYGDDDAAEQIINWLRAQPRQVDNYKTMLMIADGVDLPLFVIVGTCWGMVKRCDLKVTVDRMGKPTAVALRDR